MRIPFEECYKNNRLILTEGAIGRRLEREYQLTPDKDMIYAALIYDKHARKALKELYSQYIQIAIDYDLPIMLFTNTRRANRERVLRSRFRDCNVMKDYTEFLQEIAAGHPKAYVGGMLGCKNNAYSGSEGLETEEAVEFHTWQLELFIDAKPDLLYAAIMPTLPEAIGMARAMQHSGMPYIISLMISGQGRLLDGTTIHDAIAAIDGATDKQPLCYITNCVHPDILYDSLSKPFNQTELVKKRFRGIQANAACMTPDRLDCSTELMTSAPEELADSFLQLHRDFGLQIYGGCCGTDHRHIREIVQRILR